MEERQELVIETRVLWRMHANLNRKGARIAARGDVKELEELSGEAKEILRAQGTISRVSVGPLSALPGWKERSKKLLPLGIETVEQLLGVSDADLGERLNRKPETIARWKLEAMDWLRAPVLHG